jgi:hypothetical protein
MGVGQYDFITLEKQTSAQYLVVIRTAGGVGLLGKIQILVSHLDKIKSEYKSRGSIPSIDIIHGQFGHYMAD